MGRASQFTTITGPRAKESSSFSKSSECRNRTPKVPDLPHKPRASSSRILASKTNFLSSRGDLVYRCSGLISVMCAIWVYSVARLDVLRHQRSARPLETCRDPCFLFLGVRGVFVVVPASAVLLLARPTPATALDQILAAQSHSRLRAKEALIQAPFR